MLSQVSLEEQNDGYMVCQGEKTGVIASQEVCMGRNSFVKVVAGWHQKGSTDAGGTSQTNQAYS